MTHDLHRQTLDQIKAGRDWTRAEQKLLEEAHTGEVIISLARPDAAWPEDARAIRAGLIRHITLGGCEDCPVPPKGVFIIGAMICGKLDLEGCHSPHGLKLTRCRVDTTPFLRDAHLGALYLPGCALPGLDAQRLRVDSSVLLNHGFAASGPVDLSSARVTGQVDCTKGQFDGQGGEALEMGSITIGADLFLRDGFAAKGTVNLTGARVTGQVDCTKGQFDGQDGVALNMNAITIRGSLFLSDGFAAKGMVNLRGAQVTGQVACIKGQFDGQDSVALNMDATTIGADLFLRDGFAATGLVNLTRAQVTGQVDCSKGQFDGQDGVALNMNAITIGADLFLSDGFAATGHVHLTRGTVTGHIFCHGGTFDGGLAAEGLTVKATLYFHDVTHFDGPLDLSDAHLGRLHDDAASWQGADPLILNGLRYDRLSGDLRIRERLDWLGRKNERWIEPAFGVEVAVPGLRLKRSEPWIGGSDQPQCDPHPYTQLARVLHEQGVSQGAARVLEERDRRVLRASRHRALAGVDGTWRAGWAAQWALLRQPFEWLFRWVFGYGHHPARALFWVAGILILNTWLYAQTWDRAQMAPTSAVVLTSQDWTDHVALLDGALDTGTRTLHLWDQTATAKDYTTFQPFLYALDLFIPLDALGQEEAWAPSPTRGLWGQVGFWSGWVTQLSGWLITAIAAAAVAGIVGRKD